MSNNGNPTQVWLRIAPDGDRLKFTWGATFGSWGNYSIGRQRLQDAVDNIRKELDALIDVYLQAQPDPDDPAAQPPPLPDYSTALRRLAWKGSDLYFELFRGVDSQNGRDAAMQVLHFLESQQHVQLIVAADPTLHIPWGLVFAGDYTTIPDGEQARTSFQDFWAYKYILSVSYGGMKPKDFSDPLSKKTLLSMLNKVVYEGAPVSAHEKTSCELFLSNPAGKAQTRQECVTKLGNVKAFNCLIHVYAHASGSEIELSTLQDERFRVIDFNRYFFEPRREGPGDPPECLLLLNGCNTTVGKLDSSFLTLAANDGCSGIVGLESPVPETFAFRFGRALLYMLYYEGIPVQRAVDKLRERHWPLGLLYASLAHPEFRFDADAAPPAPPYTEDINFSYYR